MDVEVGRSSPPDEQETHTDSARQQAVVQSGQCPARNVVSEERPFRRKIVIVERGSATGAASIFPPPQYVRIVALTPRGDRKEASVALVRGSARSAILAAVERRLQIAVNSALLFSMEAIFDCGLYECPAVLCFHAAKKKRKFWIDSEDGAQIKSDERAHPVCFILRVLHPFAPFPTSPRLALRILVEPNADVLYVTESRDLEAAPHGALSDPAFVALLRGVRCGAQLFCESDVGGFIGSASCVRYARERIPGDAQRFFVALMRAGSPVPRCKHDGDYLRVWRRSGLQLAVRGGRVQSTGRPLDIERWDNPLSSDDFLGDFCTAASR